MEIIILHSEDEKTMEKVIFLDRDKNTECGGKLPSQAGGSAAASRSAGGSSETERGWL